MKICVSVGMFSFSEVTFWSAIAIALKSLPNRQEETYSFWLLSTFISMMVFYMIINDIINVQWIYYDIRGGVSKTLNCFYYQSEKSLIPFDSF